MLIAVGRITHDPNGRRRAPAVRPKGRRWAVAALSQCRSGGFGPGERSAPLLRACELRYSVAESGWMHRPSGKCRMSPLLPLNTAASKPTWVTGHVTGQGQDRAEKAVNEISLLISISLASKSETAGGA